MLKFNQNNSPDIPPAFLEQMSRLLGAEYLSFLDSLHQPPHLGLRVNTLKISLSRFSEVSPWPMVPVPWCSTGFIINTAEASSLVSPPGKHPYHIAGVYYLQEPSAMAAAEVLAPLPGEKVLDLAAAPGGKATQMAALMSNSGLFVVNEIHPKRVWDLVENLERCGITNSVVTNETPQRLADHFAGFFDRVLLDAPCSGEGMFRKSDTARREWRPDLVHSCALRQSSILEQAYRLLRPGGRLVYSTCTFSPDENEAVIARFLDDHPEFDIVHARTIRGLSHARPDWIGLPHDDRLNRGIRIWPHQAAGEGHFIVSLVRDSSPPPSAGQARGSKRSESYFRTSVKMNAEMLSAINDFCVNNLIRSFDPSRLELVGSHIYLLPYPPLDIKSLKIIRPGWWLGSYQKGHFTPSHALAMGVHCDQARHLLKLEPGDPRYDAYLSGENMPCPGEDAWVMLIVNGFPIGWGKRSKGVLKNHYPHRLRARY
jgi:NOL1/NOP2/sun family putative RNA methylase